MYRPEIQRNNKDIGESIAQLISFYTKQKDFKFVATIGEGGTVSEITIVIKSENHEDIICERFRREGVFFCRYDEDDEKETEIEVDDIRIRKVIGSLLITGFHYADKYEYEVTVGSYFQYVKTRLPIFFNKTKRKS